MCGGLVLQVQQGERKLTAQIKTLERHLEMERQVQKNLQTYTSEIEETLKTSTEESQKQVSGVPAATTKLQPRLKKGVFMRLWNSFRARGWIEVTWTPCVDMVTEN